MSVSSICLWYKIIIDNNESFFVYQFQNFHLKNWELLKISIISNQIKNTFKAFVKMFIR